MPKGKPAATQHEPAMATWLAKASRTPILTREKEAELFSRLRAGNDRKAEAEIAEAHLMMVARTASRYRNYGIPVQDLIAEGSLGLVQALWKFDPSKGFRFNTYALWWIRAAVQEHVVQNFSVVRTATTATRKTLFFRLRRTRTAIEAASDGSLTTEQAQAAVAAALGKPLADVASMWWRMDGRDSSLNVPVAEDSATHWIDALADGAARADDALAEAEEGARRERVLSAAVATLAGRELDIVTSRTLSDNPDTLADLGQRHKVSRERIRQLESRAIARIAKAVRASAGDGRQARA